MQKKRHAVLGGTFDHLHAGHHALLASAFRVGRLVSIGVTTDRFLAEHRKPGHSRLQSYETRQRRLRSWLARHYPKRRWATVPLSNRFGRSVEPGVDVLVVSAETVKGGRAVNRERRRLGRRPVPLVVVPVVLADDLGPVSSRRIRSGEIDPFGRRRSPIRVGVAVSAEDRRPVARAVRRVFPSARLTVLPPGRSAKGTRGSTGARSEAKRAVSGRDLGLAALQAGTRGWWLAERSPATEIVPQKVPPGGSGSLYRATLRLLRPARA